MLAVGLESGGLQLWGLQRKAGDSASGYTGGSLLLPVFPSINPTSVLPSTVWIKQNINLGKTWRRYEHHRDMPG